MNGHRHSMWDENVSEVDSGDNMHNNVNVLESLNYVLAHGYNGKTSVLTKKYSMENSLFY